MVTGIRSTSTVIANDLFLILQKWETDNTIGKIEIIRMDNGNIDVIPAPRKRYMKNNS